MPNELELAIILLQKQVKLIIEFLDLPNTGAPTLNNQKWAHELKVAEKMTNIVKQLPEMDSKVIAR